MKKVLFVLVLCAAGFSLKANYSFDQIYNPADEGAKIMQPQSAAAETVVIQLSNEPTYTAESTLIANNRIVGWVVQGTLKYPIVISGNCWVAHTEAGYPSVPLMDWVDLDGFTMMLYPGQSSCSDYIPNRNEQPVYILSGRVTAIVGKTTANDNITYIVKL